MKTKHLRIVLEHLLQCRCPSELHPVSWSTEHQEVLDILRAEIDKKEKIQTKG